MYRLNAPRTIQDCPCSIRVPLFADGRQRTGGLRQARSKKFTLCFSRAVAIVLLPSWFIAGFSYSCPFVSIRGPNGSCLPASAKTIWGHELDTNTKNGHEDSPCSFWSRLTAVPRIKPLSRILPERSNLFGSHWSNWRCMRPAVAQAGRLRCLGRRPACPKKHQKHNHKPDP